MKGNRRNGVFILDGEVVNVKLVWFQMLSLTKYLRLGHIGERGLNELES